MTHDWRMDDAEVAAGQERLAAKLEALVDGLERLGESEMGWIGYHKALAFHRHVAALRELWRALDNEELR